MSYSLCMRDAAAVDQTTCMNCCDARIYEGKTKMIVFCWNLVEGVGTIEEAANEVR